MFKNTSSKKFKETLRYKALQAINHSVTKKVTDYLKLN